MKFNRKTQEKERIIRLVEEFYNQKDVELEAILYGHGCNYRLNNSDFTDIYQRLVNDDSFVPLKTQDILNITFRPNSKFTNIRVSVLGEGSIKNYCNTDSIKDIGYNVRFTYKKNLTIGDKNNERLGRVDVNEYHVRFNLKEERDIPQDSDIIKQLKDEWNTMDKIFRCKRIYSFTTSDNRFSFDLSIVKSSRSGFEKMSVENVLKYHKHDTIVKPNNVDKPFIEWWNEIKKNKANMVIVCDQPIYYKKMEESNVLTGNENYEIEVELKKTGDDRKISKNNINEIFDRYVEYIGIILQSIQKTYFIMSETEKAKVINNYQDLIKNQSNYIFKAPMPLTLERLHLDEISSDYVVTEKANGSRCMLYVDKDDKIYLINRNHSISYMGCSLVDYGNTLIDGEYLTTDINGNQIDSFMFFDVYYYKGADVRNLILGTSERDKNSRQNIMYQIEQVVKKNGISYKTDYDLFTMNRKKYISGKNIFDASEKILIKVNKDYGGLLDGHLFSYEVDGLIFMPINLGVGQNYKGEAIGQFGKIWTKIYKWKPAKFNSIDFHVKMRRNMVSKEVIDEYHNGSRYKQVYLQVSYHPNFHDRFNAYKILNEGMKYPNVDQYINFEPPFPFMGYVDNNGQLVNESQIASIYTNSDGDLITINGDIIQEGSVVEFIYDENEEEDRFKWKPYKLRENKKSNGYHTAINIWQSINFPVTTSMLTNGQYESIDRDLYILGESNKLDSVLQFHTYVSNRILKLVSENRNNLALLDLGCGKADMIQLISKLGMSFVVLIDKYPNNIHNAYDGACVKVLKNVHDPKMLKNIVTILADSSKNIANSNAGFDVLNKYYLNILYGNQEISGFNSKLEQMWGRAQKKFDIVSCFNDLGSYFADTETLENFMVNVAENLKVGGKFIGSCIDGQMIFDILAKTNVNDDNWKIEKEYEDMSTLAHSEESLGHMFTINEKESYLVDFKYMVEVLEKYGLDLVDTKLFNEDPTSFYEDFKTGKQIDATKMKISFAHRWFVFVKSKSDTIKSMSANSYLTNRESKNAKDERDDIDVMEMFETKESSEAEYLPEDIEYSYEKDKQRKIDEYKEEYDISGRRSRVSK